MDKTTNQNREHKSIIFMVLRLLWPSDNLGIRVRVLIALILVLLSKAIAIVSPLILRVIVDGFAEASFAVIPLALLLAYGMASLAIQLSTELRKMIFTQVAQSSVRRVAVRAFDNLQQLSLKFHNDRKTGGVIRAVERGTTSIEFLLQTFLFDVLPTLLELAFIVIVIGGLYSGKYTLVIVISVSLYLAFTYWATQWQLDFRRKKNEFDIGSSVQLVDSLVNHETIKYFTNEPHESQKYNDVRAAYEKATVTHQKTDFALSIGRALIVSIGSVSVIVMAAQDILNGDLTVGDFVLLNSYLLMLFAPISTFMMAYNHSKQAFTDIEALQEILTVTSDIQDRPDAQPIKIDQGRVTFDSVKFGYDAESPNIKNLSFEIPAGKTTALVGSSGGGKSTIAKLLFRFYDVQGGQIKIDDQDIKDVTQASLRDNIGIVPQDTSLFHNSIFYNILYGKLNASAEEVVAAAKAAQLNDFIAGQAQGLDTIVGERGVKLSGGEKQRVALARVILKNPPIFIFDEATSALDTKTEKDIMQNLREISQDRTTLIIAHRLSTIIDADEIIVLDGGKIVERGRHEALLKQAGAYYKMWKSQATKPK
ncbi:ABC transporter ATP-binding protein/permease [Hellea sp.]|nr:ABC transporter ATP-binding protein/permease [Hellea sp.]